MSDPSPKITIIANGPLRVAGTELCRVGIVRNEHDRPIEYRDYGTVEHAEAYSLCRCGKSANKPFCDGTHKRIEWDDAETADLAPAADRRTMYGGGDLAMSDDKSFCWHAGFCVRENGHAWNLVEHAESETDREQLREMIHSCPSGRLQEHASPDSDPVERSLAPRVAVINDGPLFVQGGVPVVGAEGIEYASMNRMSLCRCGASANKPYCDGAHTKVDFRDSG